MRRICNFAWWAFFIAAGLWAQLLAPGLDVLAVGLIILMQERDYRDLLWLAPLFVLLQEGMGTRPFGAVILWYSATVVIFILGRRFFEVENFVFIFMLSACMGAAYFGLAWLMAPLQDLAFNVQDTLDKSLIQAIFIPFTWRILVGLRKVIPAREEA